MKLCRKMFFHCVVSNDFDVFRRFIGNVSNDFDVFRKIVGDDTLNFCLMLY